MLCKNPLQRKYNLSLKEYINIRMVSIIETSEHAAKSYLSTLAVMRLSELLTKSKKVAEVPVKKGTKNQKPFLKMYIMQLDKIKMAVGLQKSTGDFVYSYG